MLKDLRREFMRLSELTPEGRATELSRLDAADPGFATELRALLTQQAKTTDLVGIAGARLGADATSLKPTLSGLAGTRIGNYRLTRVVGEGGAGVVYEARQFEPLERTVAVKLLDPAFAETGLLAGMEAEHRLLARLAHPGIVTVFDAGIWRRPGTERDVPFVVTELIDGPDCLTAAIERGWSLPRVLSVFRSVAEAMAYAHRVGIVHRDLKPANVLIDAEGRVRVIDFGIAGVIGAASALPVRAGTRDFAAPETSESGTATERSDVYSLGVLLNKLLACTAQTPRMLHRDALEIASVCCRADPEARYANATLLCEDLDNAADRRPLRIAARPFLSMWYRLAFRHRVTAAAACVLLASLVATAVVSIGSASVSKRAERAAVWSRSVALHGTASMAIASG